MPSRMCSRSDARRSIGGPSPLRNGGMSSDGSIDIPERPSAGDLSRERSVGLEGDAYSCEWEVNGEGTVRNRVWRLAV